MKTGIKAQYINKMGHYHLVNNDYMPNNVHLLQIQNHALRKIQSNRYSLSKGMEKKLPVTCQVTC